MLIRSYWELPREWEPSPLIWLPFDLLEVSSAVRDGRLLLIRERGVLLMLRLWLPGACSICWDWCFDGIMAPLGREPVWETLDEFFASLILVCFFGSPGWLCLMSIKARLMTFFTPTYWLLWGVAFLDPSLVLITSFYELLTKWSILLEFLPLPPATYWRPIIGEGDCLVVMVPPSFFCLLMTRAYLEGELWLWVVRCKAFKLRV